MVVIQIVGLVNGIASPLDGEFLVEYDPGRDGMAGGLPMTAHIKTTPRLSEAKRYAGMAEAHAEWIRVDPRQPIRIDGKPNRPLTAFSCEFKTVA